MPYPVIPFNPKYSLYQSGRKYISQFGSDGLVIARGNLPLFEAAISALELATGFKWKVTSLCRQSPSHKRGIAVDIAPDISASSLKYYAVTHLSDPVLYKREKLIRLMQAGLPRYLSKIKSYPVTYNYFIEPDHIHLHLSVRRTGDPRYRIVKFGGPKACYRDSVSRSKMPLIRGNSPANSAFSPLI